MGISSKKSTQDTTSNSTSNSSTTTTPNNPSWVTDPIQNLIGQISGLGATNPQNYVAPASSLQQQAFGQGAASLGNVNGNFGDATRAVAAANSATTPMVTPTGYSSSSLLDGLENYVNPELNNVVRTSLQGYDKDAAAKQAAYAAQGAKNNAFGGSRYALGEAQLGSDLATGRAATEAGLRSDAYDKAFNYSNLDAARRQEAKAFGAQSGLTAGLANQASQNSAIDRYLSSAGLLSGIGTAQDASNRDNINTLAGLGNTQRSIEQSQATAPISLAQVQQALLSGLPLSLFTGQSTNSNGTSSGTSTQTTTSSPSLLGGIGQGAQAAASLAALFSDRRLKRDIRALGQRGDHKWYSYEYVWGGGRTQGVMADEVLAIDPGAVIVHPSGYLMVDYGRIA